MADNIDISKDLEQSIRDSRRLQGDVNTELNKSINLLSQINDLRDQSIAKVKALNRETINTRDIQRELKKAKEKDELTTVKISKLESSLTDIQKQNTTDYIASISARLEKEQQIERARLQGNTQLARFLGAQLNQIDQIIGSQEQNLTVDERRYAAAIQANKVSKETISLLQQESDIEEKIQKSVGFTGIGLGKISEKLGLGTKYYGELVEKARELEDEGKKLTFGDKLKALKDTGKDAIKETFSDPLTAIPAIAGMAVGAYKLVESGLTAVGNAAAKAGNFMAGLTEDSSNIVRGLTSGISDLARKIPLVGGLIGGLIDGFSAILDLVIGVDDKIVKAGRQLNMTANEARAFNRSLQDASFNNNNLFVNSKKLLESQVNLTNQLGIVNKFSNEILETNIMLKDFAGLEADVRQRIVELSMVNGKTAQNTTKTILAQVEGLKSATGIELQSQKILKEVASQSGYIGLQFTKYPAQLTKSLLTVKSMGLELKDLDSIASSFLDFESSISKEFEAQLLTGKEINLTKAREAFLNNDLVTAASEITRQVGTSEDFLKLNRIQAESLADAFGMSRDQLGEMLRQQEILAVVGGKQGDTARRQLELGRQKYQNEKELAAALGEQNYEALINASAQEKIAGFIEKIKQSIVDFVERTNIIQKIENFVNMLQDPKVMQGILGKIRDTISTFISIAGELLADVVEVGGEIANFFTFGPKGDERERRAYELGAKIRAGSNQMSQNVKSIGLDFKPVSVENNKVKSEVKSNQPAPAPERDNRMVANPENNKDTVINLHYHNADEVNTYTVKLGKGIPMDTQMGQSGYVVLNNNAV
jgi:hypothetical protein